VPLDPSTLCARTTAGDAELAAPRHGLAIAHRRLLSILDHPAPLDELAHRPGILADRLEKDLLRLAERGLVEIHAPSVPSAAASRPAVDAPQRPAAPTATRNDAPRPWIPAQPGLAAAVAAPAPVPESRVMLGRRVRHGRALVLGFLTLVAVCAIAWWFAAPPHEPPPPVAAAPVPAPARRTEPPPAPPPPSVPEPVRVLAMPESFVTNPAPPAPAPAAPPAAVRPSPAPPVALASTTGAPPAAPIATRSDAPVPPATAAAPPRTEGGAPKSEPPASTAPAPVTLATPAATAQPAAPAVVVPVPPPSAPPPVQLAAAAPSTLPTRPATRKLEPVAREEPDFPRDALANGITKGMVRARLAIDASGKVTGVEILDAQPRRVFDRAVTRALARWTYEPGEPARTTEVEVSFSRE
jgi:TonB family protein